MSDKPLNGHYQFSGHRLPPDEWVITKSAITIGNRTGAEKPYEGDAFAELWPFALTLDETGQLATLEPDSDAWRAYSDSLYTARGLTPPERE
jgi:hypothetical protein